MSVDIRFQLKPDRNIICVHNAYIPFISFINDNTSSSHIVYASSCGESSSNASEYFASMRIDRYLVGLV